MSYAILTEGLGEEALKDLDYALDAEPGKPSRRQKGVGGLMSMMGGQGGAPKGPRRREVPRRGGRR